MDDPRDNIENQINGIPSAVRELKAMVAITQSWVDIGTVGQLLSEEACRLEKAARKNEAGVLVHC